MDMKRKSLILGICLLTAILTGCEVKTASNYSVNSNSNKRILYNDLFADVCNGSKIAEAAQYEKTAGTISPVLIFYQSDAGKRYQDQSFSNFPKDWMTDYSTAEKNQLVACITITDRKKKRKCTFPESGKKYVLTMNDAKYHVKIYEARTSELVAEKDFDLKADKECPMMKFFSSEEESKPRIHPTRNRFLEAIG
jgi:hypothetical protein